ncbi:Protein of unknown function [Cotesia congregata]|uniref:Uncharacterized protein n=1 Tax=Cotesia congregata TaxID=51543 RepID=A0A8J2ECH0_COTCN|nr:Protein of unknown function [Cotesia congregata]
MQSYKEIRSIDIHYSRKFALSFIELHGRLDRLLRRFPHTHIYRYTPDPEIRTTRQSVAFAEIALNNNSTHMGVEGPCALSKLMPDFITGTAIDQMHCVSGGVVKKLLSLWFDSSNRGKPYSLVDASDIINNRLISIKPPSFVHRMPRSTEDLLHWKASELKNWFFYYVLPVMNGVMQLVYYEHFSLFVAGISLLNSDSIPNIDVNVASNILHKFVSEFEANDCFRYEDLNGQYLNVINGTRLIDSQIVRSHNQQLKLQKFVDELPEGKIKDFCSYKTYNDDYMIPNNVQLALENFLPVLKIQEYLRFLKDGKLYVSERYTGALQTSSSYALYRDHTGYHLGSIICFVKLSYCQCINENNCLNHRPPVHQVIIQTLLSERAFNVTYNQNVQYNIPYLYKSLKMDNYISIDVNRLISVCFGVKVGDDLYVAIPINSNNNE